MFKAFFIAIFFISISMSMITTFAAEAVEQSGADHQAATDTATKAEETTGEKVSVMDTPVNFSTPEDIEKTFQLIREQAGENELSKLKTALNYVMTYDLSMGHNKEKVYKRMNGRTPNQIISKMER